MKKVAVIGLGQFGFQVALTLSQKGYDVIAVDKKDEIVSEIKDRVTQAIILDSTDESAMWSANIESVDQAVVAIGSNVQSSLLTAALLKQMNIDKIFVRAITSLQEGILRRMGIDNIINIEKEMGIQVSNALVSEGVGKYVEISNKHSLIEVVAPKPLVGKTLKELNMRTRFKLNIVGIKTRISTINDEGDVVYKSDMTDVPDPNYPLKKEDVLVIVGTDDNIGKLMRIGQDDD